MELHYSKRFLRSYANAPERIQRAFDRRASYLAQNLRHPSLQTKKYDEAGDIWQGRANGGWHFYFQIKGNVYWLLGLKPHPK